MREFDTRIIFRWNSTIRVYPVGEAISRNPRRENRNLGNRQYL